MIWLVLLLLLTGCNSSNPEKNIYLSEVNTIRTEGCYCGDDYFQPTQPLAWNERLEKASYLHSKDMHDRNYFSHVNGSSTPAKRLSDQGYAYRYYAENIYQSIGYFATPKEAVNAWKNSPEHCKNLMNPIYTEMGTGTYKGYYTQLFGKR